jgi:hypothetical protein
MVKLYQLLDIVNPLQDIKLKSSIHEMIYQSSCGSFKKHMLYELMKNYEVYDLHVLYSQLHIYIRVCQSTGKLE